MADQKLKLQNGGLGLQDSPLRGAQECKDRRGGDWEGS